MGGQNANEWPKLTIPVVQVEFNGPGIVCNRIVHVSAHLPDDAAVVIGWREPWGDLDSFRIILVSSFKVSDRLAGIGAMSWLKRRRRARLKKSAS